MSDLEDVVRRIADAGERVSVEDIKWVLDNAKEQWEIANHVDNHRQRGYLHLAHSIERDPYQYVPCQYCIDEAQRRNDASE